MVQINRSYRKHEILFRSKKINLKKRLKYKTYTLNFANFHFNHVNLGFIISVYAVNLPKQCHFEP